MRMQLRFSSVSRILLALFAASVLGYAESARATITIDEIDPSTVSGVVGSGTATTIYAGVSGSQTLGTCGTFSTSGVLSTCDNCVAGAAGDAGLLPCNKRRIHPNTVLHITFHSDTTDGYPIITVASTSGTQVEVTSFITKASIAAKTVGQIQVLWSELCSKISGGNATCDPATDLFTGTIKVGIDKDNNGSLDSTDDSTTLTVNVLDSTGDGTTTSLAKACTDTSAIGICYFEVRSGDRKLSLQNLNAINNFPVTTNTSFKYVRVLFEQRADPTALSDFSIIHPGSDYADLEIGGSTGSLTLTPARVVGLENDQVYDVKVAVVDVAGNTGYYTPAALDLACTNASSTNAGTGEAECHVARPSEVVGILSEPVNCFVATAAYGSPLEKEVSTFRAFRDRFLVPSALGKKFIRAYYYYGPKLAEFVSKSEMRRSVARAALSVPLLFSKFALREGGYAAIGLIVLIFGSPLAIALFAWLRRKRGLRA